MLAARRDRRASVSPRRRIGLSRDLAHPAELPERRSASPTFASAVLPGHDSILNRRSCCADGRGHGLLADLDPSARSQFRTAFSLRPGRRTAFRLASNADQCRPAARGIPDPVKSPSSSMTIRRAAGCAQASGRDHRSTQTQFRTTVGRDELDCRFRRRERPNCYAMPCCYPAAW